MNHDLIRIVGRARFPVWNRYYRKYLFCGNGCPAGIWMDATGDKAIAGLNGVFVEAFVRILATMALMLAESNPQHDG